MSEGAGGITGAGAPAAITPAFAPCTSGGAASWVSPGPGGSGSGAAPSSVAACGAGAACEAACEAGAARGARAACGADTPWSRAGSVAAWPREVGGGADGRPKAWVGEYELDEGEGPAG